MTDQIPPKQKTNTLAIVSLILAFIFWPAGIVTSIIALNKISKSGEKGKGIAIAALVISILGILTIPFVLFLVGSMAYFGVLDPSKMLPDRCQFPAGMDCMDRALVTQDSMTVSLRNNVGFPVTINQIEAYQCSGPNMVGKGNDYVAPSDFLVENTDVFLIKVTNCDFTPSRDNQVDETITVIYTNQESGLQNSAIGDVRGTIV